MVQRETVIVQLLSSKNRKDCSLCEKSTKIGTHIRKYVLKNIRGGPQPNFKIKDVWQPFFKMAARKLEYLFFCRSLTVINIFECFKMLIYSLGMYQNHFYAYQNDQITIWLGKIELLTFFSKFHLAVNLKSIYFNRNFLLLWL